MSDCEILHSDVFALSILWTVYYYDGILKRVGHEDCWCDFGSFWGLHGETEDLFLYCLLDILEVCGIEEGVLKKECEPEIVGNKLKKVKRVTKSSGDIKPQVVFWRGSWTTLLY